jgi:hypothetical protein
MTRKLFTILFAIALVSGAFNLAAAQTQFGKIKAVGGIESYGGTIDFSQASRTILAKRGLLAAIPATCTVGEEYFATDAAAGSNKYLCTSTNIWTQQVGSGGGEGGGPISWGQIVGGTVSDQLDLQAALDLKAGLASPSFSGTVIAPALQVGGTVGNGFQLNGADLQINAVGKVILGDAAAFVDSMGVLDVAGLKLSGSALGFNHLAGTVTDAQVPNGITVDLAATASALATNPTDCSAGTFATTIAVNGNLSCSAVNFNVLAGVATDAQIPDDITISLAAAATALAANPTDCGSGQFANGIDASGNLSCATPAGSGGGIATGVVQQVPYYDTTSSVAGDAGMTYNPTTNTLTVGALVTNGSGYSNFASQADSTIAGDIWRNSTVFKFHDGTAVRTILTDNSAIPVAKGGSGLTAIGDDELILGDGADTTKRAVLPSCSNATTSKLLYDNATETFSCGTDQTGGGGGAPTTATYVVTSADGTLSNEVVLPTCSGTDKLTFNGTTISCAADQNSGGGGSSVVGKQTSVQAGDTITANGDFASVVSLTGGSLAAGDVLEIFIAGVASNSSGANTTYDFSLDLGTTAMWSSAESACAAALPTGQTDRPWTIRATITIISIGASGTFEVAAEGECPASSTASNPFHVSKSATVTVDTTTTADFGVGTFGGAGASSPITQRQLIVRKN